MLNDLIERHRVAAESHRTQIGVTDSYEQPIPDEIWQLQFDACDVECGVVLEICAYRPANAAEQDQKARFLLEWTKHTQAEPEEVQALLTSMLLPAEKSNNGEAGDVPRKVPAG